MNDTQLFTEIGEAYHALHHNAQELARRGYAVIDGCQPSESATDLAVDIAAGRVQVDGETTSVAADTVTLAEADADDPRKDAIVWDPSVPEFRSINGDPRPISDDQQTADRFETFQPSPPALDNQDVVLVAEVWVQAGATNVVTADIRDRRVSPAGPIIVGRDPSVTLDGGTDPAADVTVQDVDADQTDALDVIVRITDDPAFSADYAFNVDTGLFWDDDQSAYDAAAVVTWDTDPGAGNDVQAEVVVINEGI